MGIEKVPDVDRSIILEAKNLQKTYSAGGYSRHPLPVLKGIDLRVHRGEIVVVVGASGAGKSTLLHILGALDRPTGGEVFHRGFDVFSLADQELARFRNREIGFVFQFHHLLPEFTAVENVAMPMMIDGKKFPECVTKAESLLQSVGLRDRGEHRPPELSGGEQQRVAVARALMNDPELVLVDEPTASLDSARGRQVVESLIQEVKSRGKLGLMVTHDMAMAELADRIIEMHDGELNVRPRAAAAG